MERLTGYDYIAGVRTGDLLVGVSPQKAFDRLAAYEDTGLEPEDVLAWSDSTELRMYRAIGTIEDFRKYRNIGTIERLTELDKADKFMRKTVWSSEPFADGVQRDGEVVAVMIEGGGDYTLCVNFDPEPCYAEFSISDIGKTVFLEKQTK